MPQKKRQHYVPQFYIKNFSRDRIHLSLINMQSKSLHRDVPIKTQCYEKYFYQSQEIEDDLGEMESHVAPIIAKAIHDENPDFSVSETNSLKTFVTFQFLRTVAQYEQLIQSRCAVLSTVSEHYTPNGIPREAFEEYVKQDVGKIPLQDALQLVTKLVALIEDLKLAIIPFSGKHMLISSDNPVVLYNNYYRHGVGFAIAGIVILLPLSSNKLLLIYDSYMYDLNTNYGHFQESKYADCLTLNILQLYNATKIAFSMDFSSLQKMKSKLNTAREARERKEITKIATLGPKGRKLIIDQGPWPLVDTQLSFLTLRQEASRIPIANRDFFERQYDDKWEKRFNMIQFLSTDPQLRKNNKQPRDFRDHVKFARQYWSEQEESKR